MAGAFSRGARMGCGGRAGRGPQAEAAPAFERDLVERTRSGGGRDDRRRRRCRPELGRAIGGTAARRREPGVARGGGWDARCRQVGREAGTGAMRGGDRCDAGWGPMRCGVGTDPIRGGGMRGAGRWDPRRAQVRYGAGGMRGGNEGKVSGESRSPRRRAGTILGRNCGVRRGDRGIRPVCCTHSGGDCAPPAATVRLWLRRLSGPAPQRARAPRSRSGLTRTSWVESDVGAEHGSV
jgi:hypothetical protein